MSESVHHGLSGERPLQEALAIYEERRNEATMEDYRQNIAMAQLGPVPEELLTIRMAIRDDAEQTRRFLMAREGMIPREEFFNRDNMARIFGKVDSVGV